MILEEVGNRELWMDQHGYTCKNVDAMKIVEVVAAEVPDDLIYVHTDLDLVDG